MHCSRIFTAISLLNVCLLTVALPRDGQHKNVENRPLKMASKYAGRDMDGSNTNGTVNNPDGSNPNAGNPPGSKLRAGSNPDTGTNPSTKSENPSNSASDAGSPPPGYQVGFATVRLSPHSLPSLKIPILTILPKQQDNEPVGQQSICTTSCKLPNPFTNTAGAGAIGAGVYAAAINPALGGGSDDCGPCGSCYAIRTSHQAYCPSDPYDPSCG